MLTVTQIATQFGVSRTTILYYEKEELLIPACRSENGYRWYGEKEIERLKAITSYRSYGLSVSSIRTLLDRTEAHFNNSRKFFSACSSLSCFELSEPRA